MLDSTAPRGIERRPGPHRQPRVQVSTIHRDADFIEDIALRQRLASHREDARPEGSRGVSPPPGLVWKLRHLDS
eukprot:12182383-Alexandrium_andersonii.AAC.1